MKQKSLYLLIGLCWLCSTTAWAQDGWELTAWGARAAGMGGVDLAIATDATAINTNPAGLIQLRGHRVDLGSGFYLPAAHFQNKLNDQDNDSLFVPLPQAAWGYHPKDAMIAFGFGAFTEGGSWSDFTLKNALLGDDTRYYSNFNYYKLAPAFAIQPHKMISIGVAPALGLASMKFDMPFYLPPRHLEGLADPSNGYQFSKIFGNSPAAGGLGYKEITTRLKINDATSMSVGGKVGLLIQPLPSLSLGAAYTLQSWMLFRGHATLDMTAQFEDARDRMIDQKVAAGLTPGQAEKAVQAELLSYGIEGGKTGMAARWDTNINFHWPQKVAVGVAYSPGESWLIGVDGTWINWSETMNTLKLYLKKPDNYKVQQVIGLEHFNAFTPMNWIDQYVVGLGVQYRFLEDFWGRAGYNYGNDPIPARTVTPVFPAIAEHHATLGLGYRYELLEVNAAFEQAFANTQEAGPDSQVGSEYDNSKTTGGGSTLNLMLSFMF